MSKKTEEDYDNEQFEESVRIGKIWKDIGLPSKTPSELDHREHQILAQRLFNEGRIIQAVIVLHGLLELELNKFWMFYQACKNPENLENIEDRGYKELTKLFEEHELIDDKWIETLKEFNHFRNKVAHNFYGIKQVIIHKTEIENKFDRGLGLSGRLPIDLLKFLFEESKTNTIAKNIFKALGDDTD